MRGFYRLLAAEAARGLSTRFTTMMQDPRQDRGLPLRLQIGGSILIQGTKLILAAAEGHVVKAGNMHTAKVIAWGRMLYNGQHNIDRFYLDTGNPHDDLVLQILCGPDGRIYDDGIWLLSLVKEYGPSGSEWLRVLPAQGALIAERRAQLADLGWSLQEIDAQIVVDYPSGVEPFMIGADVFDYADKDPPDTLTRYWRHWPKGGTQYVDPILMQESYRDNPYGSQVMNVQQRAMLYGRVLPLPEGSTRQPLDEWMWVQASETPESAMVQIYGGIGLTERDFSVVPPKV